MRHAPLIILFCTAALAGIARAEAPPTVVIADFENDLDGFKGKIARDTAQAKTGKVSAKMENDFSKGGPWITATKPLAIPHEIKQIRFWVRSADSKGLTFRLVDQTGQCHQQRPTFPPDGQWHQITLNTFTSGQGYQKFSGANDGIFHWPAQSISFIFEKGNVLDQGRGTLWIDGVEASIDPAPYIPDLEMGEQDRLGNVFLTTETVRIPVRSGGDRIAWTVTDFWHAKAAEGTVVPKDGRAVIEPNLKRTGYFEIRLVVERGGARQAEGKTTFAVVTPVDVAKMDGSPFGVMTHFAKGWDTDILPLVAKAGIRTIRDEQPWQQIEKKAGEFDFTDRLTAFMADIAKYHIEPIIVLAFANKNYDEGLTPYTPAGCEAYARYAQAVLEKYGPQIKCVEIWNEYNGTWCKGPAAEDRPKFYAQMLRYACDGVKAKRPDVAVGGGAAVLLPLPWFEGIFKNGGLDKMDAVVIHPYRPAPEGVDDEIAALKELIKKYNKGALKPIWVTETGRWDKTPDGRYNVAQYLVRMYTLLLSQEVERIYWYLMRDYQNFTTMGLVYGDKEPMGRYVPAPAYAAYANLIRQLYGAKYVRREATDPRTRIYLFTKGGKEIRVCWATAPAHVALRASAPLALVDMMGAEQPLEPAGGQACLTLTESPVFVKGPVESVGEAARFVIAPEQSTDVLGDVRLRFTLDNSGALQPLEAVLQAAGAKAPVSCAAGAKQSAELVVPDQDTRESGSRILWYRLEIGGKTAAVGGVTLRVVDPLSFVGGAKAAADGTIEVALANTSAATAYAVESVAWKIGDAAATQALNLKLPPSQRLVLKVPAAGLQPYVAASAKVTVKIKDRPPVEFSGEVADNPCYLAAAGSPGVVPIRLDAPGVWRLGAPAGPKDLGGDVTPTATDQQFTLTANITGTEGRPPQSLAPGAAYAGDFLSFAVAPADATPGDVRAGWYEFRAALTAAGQQLACTLAPNAADIGPVRGAKIAASRTGDATHYEIAIPWDSLKPIHPRQGAMRLAVLAAADTGEKGERLVGWGRGIWPGKDPQGLLPCRFRAAGGEKAAATSALAASLEPLARPPALATGKVIADSADDYSNVQGKANWFYGHFDGTGGGKAGANLPAGPYTVDDFKEMTYAETMWGYEWHGPLPFMKLARDMTHPQTVAGRPVWAVRRWKSPVAGTLRITGHISRGDKKGDGTGALILLDGVVVFSRLVGGPDHPSAADYEAIVPVKEGALVDFAVTPGPATDTNYDATKFTARVELLRN